MRESRDILLFSGTSHKKLAESVAENLGVPLGKCIIETFPDGEIGVQILENVRGRDVFVLQSIAQQPNLYLMELFILIDALKRASAASIAVVIPYYGYARQDRKDKGRVPITARLVADLLEKAGATRVLTVDLHADQVQGFFNIPVDNLTARAVLSQTLKKAGLDNGVVVAPDLGSIKYAKYYASALGMPFAVVDKRRINSGHVESGVLIGDVRGKKVLLVDDIYSTGGTLKMAIQVCKEAGACSLYAAVTHYVSQEEVPESLELEKLYTTDTVPGEVSSAKREVVTIGPLLAEAILSIEHGSSVSVLFR